MKEPGGNSLKGLLRREGRNAIFRSPDHYRCASETAHRKLNDVGERGFAKLQLGNGIPGRTRSGRQIALPCFPFGRFGQIASRDALQIPRELRA
jgi:hypothetical protein